MSMHQLSKPFSANHSMTDECGRPGTCRSNVGCPAIDDPCVKRIVPRGVLLGALRQRNSLTSPLRVQCSTPFMEAPSRNCGRHYRARILCKNPPAWEGGSMEERIEGLDTFPKLLMHHARVRPERPAIREKDLGIWQTWTWGEFGDEVRALACGLAALGVTRGEHFALVGDNRPRLYATMAAGQCLDAIPVPLYQDAVAAEMAFPIENAGIAIAFAEDQEQVDKLLECAPQGPSLTRIVYDDPRGMRHYAKDKLIAYDDLLVQGRERLKENPASIDEELAKGGGADPRGM